MRHLKGSIRRHTAGRDGAALRFGKAAVEVIAVGLREQQDGGEDALHGVVGFCFRLWLEQDRLLLAGALKRALGGNVPCNVATKVLGACGGACDISAVERPRTGISYAGEEFSAVFTNWTVSDPQNRRTLDLLADGTFPGAPDSWLRSSPGPREPS